MTCNGLPRAALLLGFVPVSEVKILLPPTLFLSPGNLTQWLQGYVQNFEVYMWLTDFHQAQFLREYKLVVVGGGGQHTFILYLLYSL